MRISHAYATDTLTKGNELASAVAAALSPPQISSACTALESFLRQHSTDQQRWFFSITFPALICRLFGFDAAAAPCVPPKARPANGWIDVAASDMDSDLYVDQISLVKYVFPNERLPEWVRPYGTCFKGKIVSFFLADLCPLFKDRIKEDSIKGSSYQVQLNVFEYYLFWFAYYPICRRTSEGLETAKAPGAKKFRLENWSYSIPGLSTCKREAEKKPEGNLYARLLSAYLQSFVFVQDLNVRQPTSGSLLHYSPGYDSCDVEQAEFVINTLTHFWLVDNDFSPLPVGLCKAFGLIYPFRSVLGETPPSPRLGDVINVFIKHLNLNSQSTMEGLDRIGYVSSPGWRVLGSFDVINSRDAALSIYSVGSWNMLIQGPLYRFILRTFLFCPMETSIESASQAFSVWVNYMEPWSINIKEFGDVNGTLGPSLRDSANNVPRSSSLGFSSSWQGFVYYLFYSSLVMHFIGFALKFLHTDTKAIVQMVAKDWEDGLCENDTDG